MAGVPPFSSCSSCDFPVPGSPSNNKCGLKGRGKDGGHWWVLTPSDPNIKKTRCLRGGTSLIFLKQPWRLEPLNHAYGRKSTNFLHIIKGNPSKFTIHFVVSSMKLCQEGGNLMIPASGWGQNFPETYRKMLHLRPWRTKWTVPYNNAIMGHLECSNPPTQVNWKLGLPLLCCGRWRLTTHRFNSGFPAFSHQTWDRNIRCIVMLTNYAWVSSICFSVQDIQHMVSQYHQVIIILLFQAYWFTKAKCLALLNSRSVGAPHVVRRCRSSGALAVEFTCEEVQRHQRKGGEWMHQQDIPSLFFKEKLSINWWFMTPTWPQHN